MANEKCDICGRRAKVTIECPEHGVLRAYCTYHQRFARLPEKDAIEYAAKYQAYNKAKKFEPGLTWEAYFRYKLNKDI